jgi:hypothetical protein
MHGLQMTLQIVNTQTNEATSVAVASSASSYQSCIPEFETISWLGIFLLMSRSDKYFGWDTKNEYLLSHGIYCHTVSSPTFRGVSKWAIKPHPNQSNPKRMFIKRYIHEAWKATYSLKNILMDYLQTSNSDIKRRTRKLNCLQ